MPIECRIGYQNIPNNEVLAKSLGLIEEKFPDIKIKWVLFPAGWQVNAAMAAGDIDIGLVGSLPVSTGIAQGIPFRVFIIHNIIGDNAALVATNASGITSVADLPGKTIGVPFGSTSHYSFLSALEQENVDAEKVNILDLSISELIARWKIKALDGAFVWQPTLENLRAVDGTVVVTAKQLTEKGSVTADLGTVSEDFAAAYPSFLTGFVESLDDATQFYRNNPSAAAEAIALDVKLSPETSLSIMNQLIWLDAAQQSEARYMGTPQKPGAIAQVLKSSADFMVSQDAIPPAPELETFQKALFNQIFIEPAS
ncbi:MAG: ABC transporter substrate-binding protein [Cyanobacteria bacterium J06598_3]